MKVIFRMMPVAVSGLLEEFTYFQRGTPRPSLCDLIGCKVVIYRNWSSGTLFCHAANCPPHAGGLEWGSGQWDHPQYLMDLNFEAL